MNRRRPRLAVVGTSVLSAALLAIGGLAAAAPAAAAAPTKLVSLTVTPASVNTTAADARVTVRARVTDADGIQGFGVQAFHVDTASTPIPGLWDAYPVGFGGGSIAIPRISGTAQDGVYEGQLLVPRSTNGTMELYASAWDDTDGITWTTADLRAIGVTAQFATVSTGQAPKLSNVGGRSLTGTGTVGGFPVITRTGVITFSIGAGYTSGIQVVKQSGCAERLYDYYPASSPITFGGRFYTPCVIQLRAFNGLGLGPTSTLTYL